MDIPASIARKLKRPAAVLGAGVSGTSAARLLAQAGNTPVLYDEKGAGGACSHFGQAEARQHDLVVYSPGFPATHPWLSAARAAGATCLGEMDFAFLFWKDPLLAITGTNGKTTLTEFLTFALKRVGREAVSAGNIGFPLSNVLALSGNRLPFPVCEVSSFQSEDMRHFAPSALLWTNFDEDHLDRHSSLEAYFRAKYRLVERLAGKTLIIGESVAAAAAEYGVSLPAFTQIATRAEVAGKIPPESPFVHYPQMENYAIARRYWLAEGLPERSLEESARLFTAPRHRLAKVAEINGVSYWNDSKGTNFHAVFAAIADILGTPDVPQPAPSPPAAPQPRLHWIGGGQRKGGNITNFAASLSTRIASAELIGDTARAMSEVFRGRGIPARVHKTLAAAVRAAAVVARPGDAVLFSPGFSSFDMFENYAARGIEFEQAVAVLKAKKGK